MSNDKEKLHKMLEENKISDEDYKLLVATLNKRASRVNRFFYLLINPFQKIAGVQALLLGLLIMLIMCVMGVYANLYFLGPTGPIAAESVKGAKHAVNFYLLFSQIIISWLTLSILFIAAAMIVRQKRIRIIDFFGTVALAMFPLLFDTTFLLMVKLFDPSYMSSQVSGAQEPDISIKMTLFSLLFALLFVWQITVYYHAFKESSGLDGKKLWLGFIAALIGGQTIAANIILSYL